MNERIIPKPFSIPNIPPKLRSKTHFEQKVENHRLTLANTVAKSGRQSSNGEDKTPPSRPQRSPRSRNTRKTSYHPSLPLQPPLLTSPRARKAIDLHLLRTTPPSQKPSNYRGTADKTAISTLVAATINKPSAATEILRIVLKLRQLPPSSPPPPL